MRRPRVSAAFEDVGETDQIALDIGFRVEQRIANSRLGRQIHHAIEGMGGKECLQGLGIFQRTVHEFEIPSQSPKPCQTSLLEGNIVVVIEVVEANHGIATAKQGLAQMIADETGRSRHKYFHINTP